MTQAIQGLRHVFARTDFLATLTAAGRRSGDVDVGPVWFQYATEGVTGPAHHTGFHHVDNRLLVDGQPCYIIHQLLLRPLVFLDAQGGICHFSIGLGHQLLCLLLLRRVGRMVLPVVGEVDPGPFARLSLF